MMQFESPWVAPSLNNAVCSHWSKRQTTLRTAAALIVAEVGKNHGGAPQKVRATIEMHRKRPMDQDGAHGGRASPYLTLW